jgi:septal ring factor EnvC (AmiA/AmiB activator)
LVIALLEDDSTERTVQTFVSQVSQNLDALRAEYEQAKPQLEQAIQQAAEQRTGQIAAEKERDKKLSFPVRR